MDSLDVSTLRITPEVLSLIAEIDEFKGAWRAIGRIAPERLSSLRRVATIESIALRPHLERAKLSESQIELLLTNFQIGDFANCDEKKVSWLSPEMWKPSMPKRHPTDGEEPSAACDLLVRSPSGGPIKGQKLISAIAFGLRSRLS